MDEHGGHHRGRLLDAGGATPPIDELGGHDAPVLEELVDFEGVEGELVQEHEDAGGDDPQIDVGSDAAAGAIADGNHTRASLAQLQGRPPCLPAGARPYPLRQRVSGLRAALFT